MKNSIRYCYPVMAFSLINSAFTPLAIAQEAPRSQTACLTVQGNGTRYLALIGQAAALLEANVYPVVTEGGSSASTAVAIIHAVLHNRSIAETHVVSTNGNVLSVAQKAALILASSTGPAESIIFLPSLDRFLDTARDALIYSGSTTMANTFFSTPNQYVSNVEALTGQSTLLIDFFSTTDFSSLLLLPSFRERTQQLMTMYTSFADMMLVNPNEFIRALVTAPSSARASKRSEEIKWRYFQMFRNEKTTKSPEQALIEYNIALQKIAPLVDAIPDSFLTDPYVKSLEAFKRMPFLGYVASMASRPFYLPNPGKLWTAYLGRSQSGSIIPLPPGVLLHSTARLTDVTATGELHERTGLNHFFQVLFPANDISKPLEAAWQNLDKNRSFLEYPATDSWGVVLPRNNIIVLKSRTLAHAIGHSIAEPGGFRRGLIPMSATEFETTGFVQSSKLGMVTYGGWMTPVDTGTIARLPQCNGVDFYADISTLSTINGGLYQFQERAIRPVLEGGLGSFWTKINGSQNNPQSPVNQFMSGLWNYFHYSKTMNGTVGRINLSFDWDNASGQTGENAKKMNRAYDDNIKAFFIRSYQDAVSRISANPSIEARNGLPELREALLQVDLGSITEPEVLNQTVAGLVN